MQLLANGKQQFINSSGAPLASGSVYFYAPGTTTPATTYQDAAGLIPNTNPVLLDSSGQAVIWGTGTYRQIVLDSTSVQIWDQICASPDVGSPLPVLAASSGAALIGYGTTNLGAVVKSHVGYTCVSVSALRSVDSTQFTQTTVTGYYASGDGGGGTYYYDSTDTTSTDNGGTVIVAADSARWKLAYTNTLSLRQFGAKLDGTTDDTPVVVKAAAALGIKGGTLLTGDGKLLIDTALTLPRNVCLKGTHPRVISTNLNLSGNFANLTAIVINPAVSITLLNGAGIDACLIYRKGLTLPAANASAFAGTAIKGGDVDCFVTNSVILGFDQFFFSTGWGRIQLQRNYFDCNNGIHITYSDDISYVTECHGWPFTTIENGGAVTTYHRGGTAYYFSSISDYNKITNCFSYGYLRGFEVVDANAVTFEGCGADSTRQYSGQIGFYIHGNSTDTRMIACQMSANETGCVVDTNPTSTGPINYTQLIGCDFWGNTSTGIIINSGNVGVFNGHMRDMVAGVVNNNGSSRINVMGVRFDNLTQTGNAPISNPGATSTLFIHNNDYGNYAGAVLADNPGGSGGAVSSFNTRTGAITLTTADVSVAASATAPVAIAGTPAIGTSSLYARADHAHSAQGAFINTSASGTITATNADAAIAQIASQLAAKLASSAFTQSIASIGYQKLPGGLVIQWGNAVSSGTTAPNVNGSWATPFPTACFAVIAIIGASGASVNSVTAGSQSASSYQFTVFNTANQTIVSGVGIGYIAVGY